MLDRKVHSRRAARQVRLLPVCGAPAPSLNRMRQGVAERGHSASALRTDPSPPLPPVLNSHLFHQISCVFEPFIFSLFQIGEDAFSLSSATQMDICGLPAHQLKEPKEVNSSGHFLELDLAAIRCESSNYPILMYSQRWVWKTNRVT